MCLAIPGKLLEIIEVDGLRMGRVDYSGTVQSACLEYVPAVTPGQYVLVHAGFAIKVIDEQEAERTLALFNEMIESIEQDDADPGEDSRFG
ncbi:MAG: HypC/HybG/HupF family hydrogenase formation chaperone [Candidatus Zixiibacteriota bacterium]|jgi:hydrogenase expression/formation protein HypC